MGGAHLCAYPNRRKRGNVETERTIIMPHSGSDSHYATVGDTTLTALPFKGWWRQPRPRGGSISGAFLYSDGAKGDAWRCIFWDLRVFEQIPEDASEGA